MRECVSSSTCGGVSAGACARKCVCAWGRASACVCRGVCARVRVCVRVRVSVGILQPLRNTISSVMRSCRGDASVILFAHHWPDLTWEWNTQP